MSVNDYRTAPLALGVGFGFCVCFLTFLNKKKFIFNCSGASCKLNSLPLSAPSLRFVGVYKQMRTVNQIEPFMSPSSLKYFMHVVPCIS